MVSAKEYRPWEMPRITILCASCGERTNTTQYGLCEACTHRHTRGTTTWAPAFPSPASLRRTAPDGRSCPAESLPPIEPPIQSAGAALFPRRSRDTW